MGCRRPIGAGRRYVALLAALALGCETAEAVGFALNPFGSTEVTVVGLEQHGPYLFADVSGRKLAQRFAAPASEACVRVLAPEKSVRYAKSGNFGRFSREDEGCDAVGTLSLTEWRDGQPRPRRTGGSVVPRTTARFSVAHRDAQYILLRGRFALAARVGVPAAFDIVAVLPEDAPCREAASRREASLEFRQAGRDPFRLLVGGQSCVVTGFAMPVEGLPAGPPDAAEGESTAP
jgi:hypothetical protein